MMASWGWRAGLLAALSCVVACGDNDVVIERTGAAQPGFFIGETAAGGPVSIAVGSIRSVFFRCGGSAIFARFAPPEPVAGDGSFAVDVEAGGRTFTVSGRLTTVDRIEGGIHGDPACDGDFVARRCDPRRQACGDADGDTIPDEVDPDRPNPTPTPVRTPTATPIGPTPTQAPVPTATPTTTCGNGVVDDDTEECDGSDLDDNDCFDLCDQDDEGGTLRCNPDCTFDFSGCPPPRDCEAP